ncbi:pentatricopeptide repeat-containing protein At5g50390, chloroplastic-like [Rhodamnia argentea]|uniref:Pentatricopeptide repeat-containing protein At5g50390, chloroplastic-like n=1 Tax=Rhodamnia argentea TaxID=178133 RepID=A0A8B8P0C3_9MYRT|nr:pentatricopeptide repeat-containing protein At5g50390, chloroplastic-like [Rhodamnia argentea]
MGGERKRTLGSRVVRFGFTFGGTRAYRSIKFSANVASPSHSQILRYLGRHPFYRVKCSSVEQELRPRPKPKQSKFDVDWPEQTVLEEDTGTRKHNPRICSHIEKLALHGRYRWALELFEILEFEGRFEVGCSTYDTLVRACIGLRSVGAVKRVFNYQVNTVFELDSDVRNRVLLMLVRCRMIMDARKLFDEMLGRSGKGGLAGVHPCPDEGDLVCGSEGHSRSGEASPRWISERVGFYSCSPAAIQKTSSSGMVNRWRVPSLFDQIHAYITAQVLG